MSEGTRIDFYHLSTQQEQSRLLFTCKLADKAFRQGLRVLVCLPDASGADRLDELMWTFSDSSFLPHAVENREDPDRTPVLIAATTRQHLHRPFDLLVNLATDQVEEPDSFRRIAEIIISDEDGLRSGRKRYSHYKNAGFPLHYHEINV